MTTTNHMGRRVLSSTFFLLLALRSDAFYLPGAAPHDYHQGDRVELFVNALTPMSGSTGNAKLVHWDRRLSLRRL